MKYKTIDATPIQVFVAQHRGTEPIGHLAIGGDRLALSALEGAQYNRYCICSPEDELFYLEWISNGGHVHQYLILLNGNKMYIGKHPLQTKGLLPILEEIANSELIKRLLSLMHKKFKNEQPPQVKSLDQLQLPVKIVESPYGGYEIHHKNSAFRTETVYATLEREIPYSIWHNCNAIGHIDLFEGRLYIWEDGSIRLVPYESYEIIGKQVQGDLISYPRMAIPPDATEVCIYRLDRHIIGGQLMLSESKNGFCVWLKPHSPITVSHPEHGDTTYCPEGIEQLAFLPGTSTPFQGGMD